jgi:D-alanyl-D-alanine carboxypeptidase (penicillin-binding protein 5/6)
MRDFTKKSTRKIRISFLTCLVFSLFLSVLPHSNPIAGGITSEAAAIMDASTGQILYGKNSDDLLLPASTAKLMTAIIVMEKADLTDIVTISPKASRTPSLKSGFKKGDKVTIESLL